MRQYKHSCNEAGDLAGPARDTPSRRKKKRKKARKVVRHQTRTKIDQLVDANRSPTSLVHHVELLKEIHYDRLGITPGLSAKEARREKRDRDIRQIYRQETACPAEQRIRDLQTGGMFLFSQRDLQRQSSKFQLNFQLPQRAHERTSTRWLALPEVHPLPTKTKLNQVGAKQELIKPSKPVTDHGATRQEQELITMIKGCASQFFARAWGGKDARKSFRNLELAVSAYQEVELRRLRLHNQDAYWSVLLTRLGMRDDRVTPDLLQQIPNTQSDLEHLRIRNRTSTELARRLQTGNLPECLRQGYADELTAEISRMDSAVEHWRQRIVDSIEMYFAPPPEI